MENLLRDYPVVVEFSVAWGEMDATKHVDNIVLRKRILDIQKSSPQG